MYSTQRQQKRIPLRELEPGDNVFTRLAMDPKLQLLINSQVSKRFFVICHLAMLRMQLTQKSSCAYVVSDLLCLQSKQQNLNMADSSEYCVTSLSCGE